MFSDEKIQLIESMQNGDSLVLIWVKLLTLAGKSNQGGLVNVTCHVTYSDEMLSVILKKPIDTIKNALNIFKNFEMIEICDKGIYIINFEKHQNIDGMDKIREQNRIRKQKERERKSIESQDSHVTVTQSHAIDIDKEIRIKNKNKNIKHKTLYLESVYLSDDEFDSLIEKYGSREKANLGIETLNNYIQASGKKYKSHFHVLIGWVFDRVNEQKVRPFQKMTSTEKLQQLFNEYEEAGV